MAAIHSTQADAASEQQAEAINMLSNKVTQLHSMLTVIIGEGFESFNNYNDNIKENYLWACADIADEVKRLSDEING